MHAWSTFNASSTSMLPRCNSFKWIWNWLNG